MLDKDLTSLGNSIHISNNNEKIIQVVHVDDEDSFLELTKQYLNHLYKNQFQITSFNDPVEALKHIQAIHYDVLILDYKMPVMSGLDVLKNLRTQSNEIPVIFFTGKGRKEVVIKALNLGANYYLQKSSEDHLSQFSELGHIIHQLYTLKHTREELRESIEKYQMLVNQLNEGVHLEDETGKITFVNPRVFEMTHYSEEEVIGQHWTFLVPESDLNFSLEESKKRPKGIDSTYESGVKTKDGTKIPVIVTAKSIFSSTNEFKGVLSVFTDITMQKKAEMELRASEQRFRTFVNSLPQCAFETDQEGNLTYVNKFGLKIFGYSREDVKRGIKALDCINESDRPRVIEFLRKSIDQVAFTDHEFMAKRKDGSIFPVLLYSTPIINKGNVVGRQGIIFDITELKEAENRLKQQNEELSGFAHFIAHEIGNGLAKINGFTQLLESTNDLSYLKRISEQIEYQRKILKRTLALADVGIFIDKKDQIILNKIVETAAKQTIPKEILVTIRKLPKVNCDAQKMLQVFTNLFENAIIHGSPTYILVSSRKHVKNYTILVTNDGEKIAEEVSKRIFDHGFTTKRGNMGLGLPIVKKIIESHGWKIFVDSEAKNTTFKIQIPINDILN